MKKMMIFALLALTLLASVAMGRVKGGEHDAFTKVFVSDTGNFRIFAIINTGANDVYIRFAYTGNSVGDLSTDSLRVPAGSTWSTPNDGDIGATAKAYWLSSATSTVSITYD